MTWLLAAAALLFASFSSAENISRCNTNAGACLAEIDASLKQAKPKSLIWFELKMGQMEVLFDRTYFDRLRQELAPWVNRDDVPPLFRTRVSIYHAKMLKQAGKETEAKEALLHASELLQQTNEAFPRPHYLIEIANLQLDLGQKREAYDTLIAIEKRFQGRNKPEFQHELYANLGHAAHSSGDLNKAAFYREQSVEWSLKSGDKQQYGVAYGNLAFTYQLLGQHDKGAALYKKAVESAKAVGDANNVAIYYVRLAENLVALKRFTEAKQALDNIDSSRLASRHLNIMMKLQGELRKAEI